MQNLPLPLSELQKVLAGPFPLSVELPLSGSLPIYSINHSSLVSVFHRFVQEALWLIIQVKEHWLHCQALRLIHSG